MWNDPPLEDAIGLAVEDAPPEVADAPPDGGDAPPDVGGAAVGCFGASAGDWGGVGDCGVEPYDGVGGGV